MQNRQLVAAETETCMGAGVTLGSRVVERNGRVSEAREAGKRCFCRREKLLNPLLPSFFIPYFFLPSFFFSVSYSLQLCRLWPTISGRRLAAVKVPKPVAQPQPHRTLHVYCTSPYFTPCSSESWIRCQCEVRFLRQGSRSGRPQARPGPDDTGPFAYLW